MIPMRIDNDGWPRTRIVACGLAALAGCLLTSAACHQPPGFNIFVDDSIPADQWSTPSRDSILAAGHDPVIRERGLPVTGAPHVAHNDVAHLSLWWEDPFEDHGDGNEEFSWNAMDFIHMPYGLGRFIVNTIGWPISLIVTPPGMSLVSDGQIYVEPEDRIFDIGIPHPHDAYPGTSENPTAGPADFEPARPEDNLVHAGE